jgi:large subunit ribosomal protein L9
MELILLENVRNLGSLGKKVKVKPGYARNYLLPKKKAVLANNENLKYFEERKDDLHQQERERIQNLEKRAASLNGMQIEIAALVSEEGKLYGSVGVNDIADAIIAAGGNVSKHEVLLSHGPIRELGIYEIQLGLNHGEMRAAIALNIVAKDKS